MAHRASSFIVASTAASHEVTPRLGLVLAMSAGPSLPIGMFANRSLMGGKRKCPSQLRSGADDPKRRSLPRTKIGRYRRRSGHRSVRDDASSDAFYSDTGNIGAEMISGPGAPEEVSKYN
jgi:hypothetical protein